MWNFSNYRSSDFGRRKSNTYLDVQQIARDVIKKIGYTKSDAICLNRFLWYSSAIHEQSADINQGVTVLIQKSKEQVTKEWCLVMHQWNWKLHAVSIRSIS
jgi:S-adenosylmethionine synthetase